jgi:acyl carrier protein
MSIRSTIITQMGDIAASQDKTLAPLTDDLVLLDCGLDSLCFAILVAQLEDELGFDPFTASEDAYFPVTFGDFVAFYEAGAGARSHAA